MKTAVIGAGAIGGYFAAMLAEAAHESVLCVRTPFDQLTLEDDGKREIVATTIVSRPEAIAEDFVPADLVVLATKAQDSESAESWLRRLVGPETLVLVAQNGVDHVERVGKMCGEGRIVSSIVYVAAERVAPGRIVHHSNSRLVVPDDEDGRRIAEIFSGTKLKVETEPDFLTAAWRKLLSNVVANPITALTLRRMDVFKDPDVADLTRALMKEAVAVAAAQGARLDDGDVERVLSSYDRINPESGSSMLYDRLAGRSLEHEHLTGAVVRAGERHGVATPLNRAILTLLSAVDPAPIARP